MKELEKTKSISIISIVFILALLIALLSYKKPKHLYQINSKATLEKVTTNDFYLTLEEISNPNYTLIDIRNPFEFNKGHLQNAINIPTPELLNDENSEILKNLKEQASTIVLYGSETNEAITPFMILYQLGYDQLKIARIKLSYEQNNLITQNSTFEKNENNIKSFIEESVKKAIIDKKPIADPIKKITPPKKVITIEKKKKAPTEGGC